uniref:NADH dehydrogenase subunit 6 n=1 Tax=Solecurtus divaricatus TaxID=444102 RepID=J3JR36_9BIVA|nr:NADH dehydrogenase subunit 6 [Solecurtus divaricatus]AEV94335.1 NADH dehydrogenase subunit 6 [Solecurtus divaricatus]
MSGMVVVVFWSAYVLLFLSLALWFAKHPLGVGACVLLLYMVGSVVVGFVVSFVAGVFLFLTGVSGMMVAFLYVVALCPNPVFNVGGSEGRYHLVSWGLVGVLPAAMLVCSVLCGFGVEMGSLAESYQWMSDPCMFGGLGELMPFLGGLLFLCMVSVVSLCGQQKQCLGGSDFFGVGGVFSSQTKRVYA